jgi:hypothetical protein
MVQVLMTRREDIGNNQQTKIRKKCKFNKTTMKIIPQSQSSIIKYKTGRNQTMMFLL